MDDATKPDTPARGRRQWTFSRERRAYEGACPRCDRTLSFPASFLDSDAFLFEIKCSTPPGCGHRLKIILDETVGEYCVEDDGPVGEIDELRARLADWSRLAAFGTVDELWQLAAERRDAQALQSELRENVDQLRDLQLDLTETRTVLSLQVRELKEMINVEVGNRLGVVRNSIVAHEAGVVDSIQRVSDAMNVLNKVFVEMQGKSQREQERHRKDVEVFRQQLQSTFFELQKATSELWQTTFGPKFGELSKQFEMCSKNVRHIAVRLSEQTAIANNLAGKLHAADGAIDQEAQSFARRLRDLVADPETLSQIVRRVATYQFSEADGIRESVVEKLPSLIDVIEREFNYWRRNTEDPAQAGTVVLLENLLRAAHSWLNARGIERFGRPGDLFDYALHDTAAAEDTSDPQLRKRIKEVVFSGYRLREGNVLLRRARVIIWQEPLSSTNAVDDATPTGSP